MLNSTLRNLSYIVIFVKKKKIKMSFQTNLGHIELLRELSKTQRAGSFHKQHKSWMSKI